MPADSATDAAVAYAVAVLKSRPRMRYARDPIGFFHDVLGWHPWSVQERITVEGVLEHRTTAVAKCHASGGTALAARICHWFLQNFQPSVALTTAPVDRQVRELLWREFRTAYKESKRHMEGRLFEIPRFEIAPNHYAIGFATDNPDNVPGFHSENVLIIKDEAAGIAEPVANALRSAEAGGFVRVLELSQPLYAHGPFYDLFDRPGDQDLATFKITAWDTPAFTGEQGQFSGLITQEWVNDMRSKWGEDSDLFRIRVKAEFPQLGENQVISPEWCKDHRDRPLIYAEPGPRVLGVDVAGLGRGMSVIFPRQGNRWFKPLVLSQSDPMVLAGYIVRLADRWKAECIAIDSSGLGAGVASRVQELGYPVHWLNPGSRARKGQDYVNRGTELYFTVRDLLREGATAGYMDDDLRSDLTQVQAVVQSDGRMKLDKFGLTEHSPDLGDAFVYTQAAIESLSGMVYRAEGEYI